MKNITCITLSSKPFTRHDVPEEVEYLNYVSEFDSLEGLHQSQINAINQVQTSHFVFVDDDDIFPKGVRIPTNKAMLVGDEIINTVKGRRVIQHSYLDKRYFKEADWHNMPSLIHKPVVNTKLAKIIVAYFPQGLYYTNWMLYATMLRIGGFEYDSSFLYYWNRGFDSGLHLKVGDALKQTKQWVENEMPNIVEQVKGMNVL